MSSLTSSTDLIHWHPAEGAQGSGASPFLTGKGIVLLYNGKNAGVNGSPELGDNV